MRQKIRMQLTKQNGSVQRESQQLQPNTRDCGIEYYDLNEETYEFTKRDEELATQELVEVFSILYLFINHKTKNSKSLFRILNLICSLIFAFRPFAPAVLATYSLTIRHSADL